MSKVMFETSIVGAYMRKCSNYFKIISILENIWAYILISVWLSFFLKKTWTALYLRKDYAALEQRFIHELHTLFVHVWFPVDAEISKLIFTLWCCYLSWLVRLKGVKKIEVCEIGSKFH